MRKVTLSNRDYEHKDLGYWQDNVFYKTISYALPLSILFLLFFISIAFKQQLLTEAILSTIVIACIALVSLSAAPSLKFKKNFIVVILTLMAILLMVLLGSFGIGSIYLLALTVFISLLFSPAVAYRAVVFNFFIYITFAIIIHMRMFNIPLVKHYTTDIWIAYSLNFLFFDLVVAYQISFLIFGLKSTLIKEQRLSKALQLEAKENINQNLLLQESEDHYKSLFFNNPTPMWIFDAITLKFLQVNAAAVNAYGYTEEEFTDLSIKAIKVNQEDHILAAKIKVTENNSTFHHLTQHKRKNEEIFHADINCSSILFNGVKAILTIARDVSTQIEHLKKIETQNERFKEIAYLQSHVIRAPLARMKGLYQLISLNEDEAPDKEILEHFYASLNEMDEVIHTIVNHNEENSA